MRSLLYSLIAHKSINTTITRAKALRVIAEPLITKAKKYVSDGNVGLKMHLLSKLNNDRALLQDLFTIVKSQNERKGGYTTVVRTHVRLSDATTMAQIAFSSCSQQQDQTYTNNFVCDS